MWVEQGAGNPYWDAQHAAAQEAADRLGFDFRVVSGDLDPAVQASVVQQTVDQGPDAIMVNAIDPSAVAEAYQYAADNDVPIVNLYGLDENATSSITFDEIRTGEMMGAHALSLLEARYGEPTGEVAVLHGILGQPASDLRAQGFIDFVEANGVEVVDVQPTNWQADEASATMENWLTRYPDLSMVYALSDTLAVPAMNIAERQDRLCRNDVDPAELENCVHVRLRRRHLHQRGGRRPDVGDGSLLAGVVRVPVRRARPRGGIGRRVRAGERDQLDAGHAGERRVRRRDDDGDDRGPGQLPVRRDAAGDRR